MNLFISISKKGREHRVKTMKKAIIYLLISLALLYLVREIEYAGIRKNEKGEFAKLREAFLDENNFDLLVIGSSRAECQFYTPLIDSATGLHSYNIGMTGATMPFIRASLEAYLVHSKAPKYVVLNLDLHSFDDALDTVYNFPRYFAYLGNEKLLEGLIERDKRFQYFKWLPFYSMPYYSSRYLNASIRGWIKKPGNYNADYENGFAPIIKNEKMGDLDTMYSRISNTEPAPIIWNSLDQIAQICTKNGSKLILAISPLYQRWEKNVLNYSKLKADFHAYADKNSVPMIDLSNDSIRFNKNLYSDPVHLDRNGAIVFTRHFTSELAQYLKP